MAATKFQKGSTVCFLGDSITQNGGWIRRIYQHYRRENIPCKLYNCGVGGDAANRAYFRLEETVFCYEPDHVVIAFGMNDSGYTGFREAPITEKDILNRRRLQDNCIQFLRLMGQRCLERGIAVTYCTPTLTDEWMDSETPDYVGSAAMLLEISLRIRALAEELGAGLVDFSFPFRKMSHLLNAQGKTLVNPDRVHPIREGHELMARLFLQAQGFEVDVPETWEQLQTLANLPYDAWEKKRYELEQLANAAMFVDWNFGYGKKSRQAMDAAIEKALRTETRPWIRQRLEEYAAIRDEIPAHRAALIEHTNTV